MSKEIKNYGRSVKTKLLTLSKESGIPYMTILVRYFQERLLYKVAHSDYKNNFLLKGGALLLENVPEVEILAYSLETVVAEKFEAMISLSVNNSRMKDFFDVYRILKEGNLDEEVLKEAVKNTFENRGTGYVEGHPLFGEEFFKDPIRTSRWNGFLKSIRTKEQIAFEEVGNVIQEKMKGYWEIVKEKEKT